METDVRTVGDIRSKNLLVQNIGWWDFSGADHWQNRLVLLTGDKSNDWRCVSMCLSRCATVCQVLIYPYAEIFIFNLESYKYAVNLVYSIMIKHFMMVITEAAEVVPQTRQ